MSDDEKKDVLEKLWVPEPNYKFPKSGKRNLKFQITWTHEFRWLRYSKMCDGAYCFTCVLFSPSDGLGKVNHQTPGKLVVEKYYNLKKVKVVFKDHQSNYYHKLSQLKFDNFYAVQNKKFDSVCTRINEALKKRSMKTEHVFALLLKLFYFADSKAFCLEAIGIQEFFL